MKSNDTYNEGFDLIKGTMALFVIAIHTLLLNPNTKIGILIIPLVRTAVPVFFLFSGYFFFRRMDKIPVTKKTSFLLKNLKRYLQLYLIWFIITLPVTIKVRGYFQHGLIQGLSTFINNFLFGSTFIASWYIMGLIIGIPLIYGLSKFLNKWVLFLITFFLNIYCVLLTNYGRTEIGNALWEWTKSIFSGYSPYLSFVVGLMWLVLGKLFADGDLKILVNHHTKYLAILSLGCLYVEAYITSRLQISLYTDCYIMLIPVCTLFFGWILTTHFHISRSKELRAFSTIAYCFHASFAVVLKYVLITVGVHILRFRQSVVIWLLTVIVSWILTLLILRLETVSSLKWLRLSH